MSYLPDKSIYLRFKSLYACTQEEEGTPSRIPGVSILELLNPFREFVFVWKLLLGAFFNILFVFFLILLKIFNFGAGLLFSVSVVSFFLNLSKKPIIICLYTIII